MGIVLSRCVPIEHDEVFSSDNEDADEGFLLPATPIPVPQQESHKIDASRIASAMASPHVSPEPQVRALDIEDKPLESEDRSLEDRVVDDWVHKYLLSRHVAEVKRVLNMQKLIVPADKKHKPQPGDDEGENLEQPKETPESISADIQRRLFLCVTSQLVREWMKTDADTVVNNTLRALGLSYLEGSPPLYSEWNPQLPQAEGIVEQFSQQVHIGEELVYKPTPKLCFQLHCEVGESGATLVLEFLSLVDLPPQLKKCYVRAEIRGKLSADDLSWMTTPNSKTRFETETLTSIATLRDKEKDVTKLGANYTRYFRHNFKNEEVRWFTGKKEDQARGKGRRAPIRVQSWAKTVLFIQIMKPRKLGDRELFHTFIDNLPAGRRIFCPKADVLALKNFDKIAAQYMRAGGARGFYALRSTASKRPTSPDSQDKSSESPPTQQTPGTPDALSVTSSPSNAAAAASAALLHAAAQD